MRASSVATKTAEAEREVTTRLHGAAAVQSAEEASAILFGKGEAASLSAGAREMLAGEIPSYAMSGALEVNGLLDALTAGETPMFKSKGEARRAIQQGGLYVNGARLGAEERELPRESLLHGKYLLVRKGGKTYGMVSVS